MIEKMSGPPHQGKLVYLPSESRFLSILLSVCRSFVTISIVLLLSISGKAHSQDQSLEELLRRKRNFISAMESSIADYHRLSANSDYFRTKAIEDSMTAMVQTFEIGLNLVEEGFSPAAFAGQLKNAAELGTKIGDAVISGWNSKEMDKASYDSAILAMRYAAKIYEIDKKIAVLLRQQAMARLTLSHSESESELVEVPCPPGAVPFAPIGEEGKCYAETDPNEEMDPGVAEALSREAAEEIVAFCEDNPSDLFCTAK